MTRVGPRAVGVGLLGAGVLLLAGCGGAAEPTGSGTTTSTTTTAPSTSDRIAFTRWATPGTGQPSLWTADADGSDARPVGDQLGWFPAWSPDRTHLLFDVFDDDGRDQVARVDPDGTGLQVLTDAEYSEAADYSPDGRTIVFDRSPVGEDHPDFRTALWVMDADGSDQRPLLDPADAGFDYEGEYSPDGTQIVFARYDPDADTAAVHVVGADGRDVRPVTAYESLVEHPRWSPDGSTIIYNIEYRADLDDPRNGIWTVPSDGGEPTRLLATTSSLHGFKPDYSPDGSQILFGCLDRTAGTDDLCVMAADGNDVTRIVRSDTFENHPVWD
jgi:Tol biopolymer transport system component